MRGRMKRREEVNVLILSFRRVRELEGEKVKVFAAP